MPHKHRWQQRLDSYTSALNSIEIVAPLFSKFSDLEKDGAILRYQFTFDLAWKVMQDFLQEQGYEGIRGPRSCIRQMAQDGYVDAFVWEDMLTVRND